MDRIYHITTRLEAMAANQSGEYVPQSFGVEGFIHCSYLTQVVVVADRGFRGRSGLVLLEIDRALLPCAVLDENLEGGEELFPHIYGPLPMSAVLKIHEFPCDNAGQFALPTALSGASHHD
jgi:uncharacterized protein (DUF952 family)